MLMYRSPSSGKIYRAVKDSYTGFGLIQAKKKSEANFRENFYVLGPYDGLELAEMVLRRRAKRWNWEELKDDDVQK